MSNAGWRGLGPASRSWLGEIGVYTSEHLRARDPVALFLEVRQRHPGASLNLLWAIAGAQDDRPWQDVARERRTELLMRLDDASKVRRAG